MKNTRGCIKPLALIVFLLGVLAFILVCAVVLVSYRKQTQARVEFTPPTVIVSEPTSGASVFAGSYITVTSTATGMKPIISVELWMDGELKETQNSERPEGILPFYADFGLLVPSDGPHMLFVRAVNSVGVIGQSPPVSLVGELKPAEAFLAVPLQAGETLDGIAAAYGIEPEILHELNQELGNPPAAGAVVKVPAPPETGLEPGTTQPPPVPAGSVAVQIPDVPMMQIASDRSTGILPTGPFIPEPFAADTAPPAAPTNLQVEVNGCKVIMRWSDNAKDEESYYIYMVSVTFHGFAIPFSYLKPSPSTGPTWFEFQAPSTGAFSLWVEAANSYGSQPSNIAWIALAPGCPITTARLLEFTLQDMSVAGNYDKAYCYVSVEGSAERRLPVWETEFIAIQGGKGIFQGKSFYTTNTFPIPDDDSVDTSGECWGWSGDTLNKLGTFSSKFPKETWDGNRQTMDGTGGSFQFGVSIKGVVENYPLVVIEATDPTLPIPYAVSENPAPSDPSIQSMYPPARTLRWKWDGDPKEADYFAIFLNGKLIFSPRISDRETIVQLPGECGKPVRWQVAVRAGSTISNLSAPVQYDLPPCQIYLRVRFDYINFSWTDDGYPGDTCDTLETYFQISVRDVTRSFWNTDFSIPLKCGSHDFSDMTTSGPYKQIYGLEPNVITIPLAYGEDVSAFWIKARFWDSDTGSDDLYASFAEHPMSAYIPQMGARWPKCYDSYGTGYFISDEAKSDLGFTYAVYPNICRDIPPETGF
jgi:hypothetical protein